MSDRLNKVAQAIKEEVAQMLIQQEIKDPRIGFVTVTRVTISADLHHATVFFSVLGDDEKKIKEAETGLKSASGYVRKLLGQRLHIRVTPQVTFRPDPGIAESIRMSKLIDDLNKKDESNG